jgi:glucosylceramidase
MKSTNFAILLSFLSVSVFCQNNKEQHDNKTFSSNGKSITVHSTSYGTDQRLTVTDKIDFTKAIQPLETEISVFVNPNKTFQTIIGIGGAITDASAETFAKLPNDKKQELLDAYYDKTLGIGYTLARTHINSCDFSSESYSYIADGDKDLKTFSIDHDKTFRIPLIKQAIKAAGNQLLIFASPWSPPAFMKDNNDMLHGGKLLPEYYDAWANYYTKFIKAYEQEGIPIWGITIQNEPMATQTWESCIYTSEEERDFLKNYLGPIMNKQGLADTKIIVWDHNRDLINQRVSTIFDDSVAAKYAWGIGFHWYETWTGSDPMFGNVAKVNEAYPSKNILFTEGCNGPFTPEKYNYWANAERYGQSIINDFNVGTVGWTDWNILLDENGGPNHVGNFCFAPIHADTKTGQLIYTPSYYYIGHFSKFIRPKAKRVSTASSRSQLLSVSFSNEDGKMVTVVMNVSDKPITYNLIIDSSEAEINILPHAIQTLVY